jgi:predicted dehydrogenase
MKHRVIHVGIGGWGRRWCEQFLPPNVADGLIEVVAVADRNPATHVHAQHALGLPARRCYTDVRRAFAENEADFCTIVTPRWVHEETVDAALAHGLHILSEKPIAHTLEASVRIAAKVRQANVKMGVTMTHRFDQDKTSLRSVLRSGAYGRLDYLVGRFTCDCRRLGAVNVLRPEMAHALFVDEAVHHLDLLADLAGAPCDTLYAQSWNPPWSRFPENSQALVLMRFANGTHAQYEAAKCNAIGLNGWTEEYVRAECEGATLVLNRRALELFRHDSQRDWATGSEGSGETLPLLEQSKWANAWLIEQFVRWLDGGPAMATNVSDNLQSVALAFAAVESARTGQPVSVQDLLAQAQHEQQ